MAKKIEITFYNPKELWRMFWNRVFWPRRKKCADWCDYFEGVAESEIGNIVYTFCQKHNISDDEFMSLNGEIRATLMQVSTRTAQLMSDPLPLEDLSMKTKIEIDTFVTSLMKVFGDNKGVATRLMRCLADQGLKYIDTPNGGRLEHVFKQKECENFIYRNAKWNDDPTRNLTKFELCLYDWLSSDTSGQLDRNLMVNVCKNRAKELLVIVRKQVIAELINKIDTIKMIEDYHKSLEKGSETLGYVFFSYKKGVEDLVSKIFETYEKDNV